ncbi:hypothetical protein ACFLZZ_02830 [Nanoarchaeota archaeon]
MRALLDKRGAFEMSMTTVVVIVLAMLMLIMGLTLVRTIFTGAKYNVENLNEEVKGEINKLFIEEDQRSAIYLPGDTLELQQGKGSNIAFAIRNVGAGAKFSYSVKSISNDCITSDPMDWFRLPPTVNELPIPSGSTFHGKLVLQTGTDAEICISQFVIEIQKEGQLYDSPSFIVESKARGLL